jgi:alpha-1,3/alpha-1,6-mannosyltransferase
VPLLQQRTPTVFYCHFPDQLLTPRRTFFYKLYRAALDRYEEWSTGCADRVLVNSRFTAGVFQDTFPSLRHIDPDVLYPGVRCGADTPPMAPAADDRITLLSINRFDPSKNLTLAVDAFAALRGLLDTSLFRRTRLVLAGSVDRRLTEQGQLLKLLQRRIDELQLHEQVELLTSVSDARREALLNACRAVVYTPIAEHFGLVPLEAMAAGRPVVAVDCGGPRETVRHAITGFLCAPEPAEFAAAMAQLVSSQPLAIQMGAMARRHVEQNFSLAVFGERLEAILRAVCRDDGVTDA